MNKLLRELFGGLRSVTGVIDLGDPIPSGTVVRAIYLAEAGEVELTMLDGSTFTSSGLAVGIWHPMEFTAVASAPAGSYGGL